MNILFDTNVVLDVLLDREPFSDVSSILMAKVETGRIRGFLCGTTITTLHYLIGKSIGSPKAKKAIQQLLSFFEIAPVNRTVLEKALLSSIRDFEDAVLHESALETGVQGIVTRDLLGFKKAQLTIYSPVELFGILEVKGDV